MKEKRYAIVMETEPFYARRMDEFGGKCRVITDKDLTLKESQRKMLDYFNRCFDTDLQNWGVAVRKTSGKIEQAYPTKKDGTRRFDWDYKSYRSIDMDSFEYEELVESLNIG